MNLKDARRWVDWLKCNQNKLIRKQYFNYNQQGEVCGCAIGAFFIANPEKYKVEYSNCLGFYARSLDSGLSAHNTDMLHVISKIPRDWITQIVRMTDQLNSNFKDIIKLIDEEVTKLEEKQSEC